jgi:hypothetical protein
METGRFPGSPFPARCSAIACRTYEQALALRIGQAYRQATAWHERLPPAQPTGTDLPLYDAATS